MKFSEEMPTLVKELTESEPWKDEESRLKALDIIKRLQTIEEQNGKDLSELREARAHFKSVSDKLDESNRGVIEEYLAAHTRLNVARAKVYDI